MDGKEPDEESPLTMAETLSGATYVTARKEFSKKSLSDGELPASEQLRRSSAWDIYYSALEKWPLLVKSATAFFILGGGDLCAQAVEHLCGKSGSGIDWLRTLRFGIVGLLGAPWSHFYFHFLDTILPPTSDPFTKTTFLKVFIDQFIQAPLLLALMISALSLLKGGGLVAVKAEISKTYVASLIANCRYLLCQFTGFRHHSHSFCFQSCPGKLWLPASLMNLAFVVPTLRVLFVNIVFIIWTVILSLLLNSNQRR